MTILAARPGMGKTSLALNVAWNCSQTNAAVAIFSLEMSKEQLTQRLIAGARPPHRWPQPPPVPIVPGRMGGKGENSKQIRRCANLDRRHPGPYAVATPGPVPAAQGPA